MHVSLTATERVIPYARNPRNNQAAVAKVAASIREFGWRQPIVVDSNMVVIVGHTRLLAAQQLGLEKVPVHVAEGLTEAQVKAYRLADNRTHEEAEWDNELLAIELGELKDSNFDLGLTGFDADELEALFNDAALEGLTDDDAIPEAPETATSRLGDVWVLGEHRLLCGDATSPDAYARLLGGNPVDMVFTDPPYNVNYGDTAKDKMRAKGGAKAGRKIMNDNLGDDFYGFLLAACTNAVTHCKKPSVKAVDIGQPSSSGQKIHSRSVALIINGSTSRFFMAGQKAISISGAERVTRAMCGFSISHAPMTCTPP